MYLPFENSQRLTSFTAKRKLASDILTGPGCTATLCFPMRWAEMLVGVISQLDDDIFWEGTSEEVKQVRQEVREIYMTIKCVTQGKKAIDSICADEITTQSIEENETIYNNETITNNYPALEYTPESGANLDVALCMALHLLIDAVLAAAYEQTREDVPGAKSWTDIFTNTFDAIFAALTFLGMPVAIAGVLYAMSRVINAAIKGIIDYAGEEIQGFMQDNAAKSAVARQLYCAMYGQQLEFDVFNLALPDGTFTDDVEIAIDSIVYKARVDLDVYLAFGGFLNDAVQYAELGFTVECASACSWCYELIGDELFEYVSTAFGGWGSWNSQTKRWQSVSAGDGKGLYLEVDLGGTTKLTRVECDVTYSGTWETSSMDIRVENWLNSILYESPIGSVGEHNYITEIDYNDPINVRFNPYTSGDNGSCYLDRIKVFGIGDNPFSARGCE